MKKATKISMILLLAIPILFIGCKKNELTDNPVNSGQSDKNQMKTEMVYCGTPLVAPMVDVEQTMSPATVTIGNDGTNLLVKYQLNLPTDYLINIAALFVGTQAQLEALSSFDYFAAGNSIHFASVTPPFGLPNSTGYGSFGSYYEFSFPLISLPVTQECLYVVAYAGLRATANPSGPRFDIWGKSQLKTSGYYLNYCIQECPPPPPLGGCETGYAYGNSYANCFLTIPGVQSNNWGWSNGPIGAGSYSWPIYAGAGQCNIGNGTLVGTLTVNYTPPTATVTYSTFNGYVLNATHLHVGNQILPKKNNKYTTAPGQFPYKHSNLNGVTSDTYTINGLSGSIYVAAHSEVCDAD